METKESIRMKNERCLDEKLFPTKEVDLEKSENFELREFTSFEDLKKEWDEKRKNYTLWDKFVEKFWTFWYKLKNIHWDIRYFVQKYITQGFSDPEVFEFAHHTTKYMIPRLKSMRKNLHGHPYVENEIETIEQWEVILDEIIWSMERYMEYEWMDNDDLPDPKSAEYELEWKRIQNGFELMGKYWMGLWD